MSVGTNIQTLNFNNIQQKNSVNFRAATIPNMPNDTVEIQGKKQSMSKGTKIGIGIVGTLLVAIGATVAGIRYYPKMLEKFYKKNLVKVNLPEKIDFKKANTLEEAIEFSKTTLGITKVDKNFTLEALNDTNRAIVDISNSNKGKFYQFKKLKYTNKMPAGSPAATDQSMFGYGTLMINSKYYDDKFLTDEIKRLAYSNDGVQLFLARGENFYGIINKNKIYPMLDKESSVLLKKFYNSEPMTIEEKRILETTLHEVKNQMHIPSRNPLFFFKNNKEVFEKEGIKIDLDKLSKMSAKEQKEFMKNTMEQYKSTTKKGLWADVAKQDPAHVIYHESGHMQDWGLNIKELSIDNATYSKITDVDKMENRWGSIDSDVKLEKLYKENPDKFKKTCPDLYEFLENEQTQQTAGLVSRYAQSGIGEFIAETYAKMVKGEKLPKQVEELYKKYNGAAL